MTLTNHYLSRRSAHPHRSGDRIDVGHTVAALAAILPCVLAPLPAVAQQVDVPEVTTANTTQVKIPFVVISGDNLVADLQSLIQVSPKPASLEILMSYKTLPNTVIKSFAIPSGDYTVQDLLTRLHQAMPELSWTTEHGMVRVTLPLDPGINNPLDQRLSHSGSGTKNLFQWMEWLYAQNPSFDTVYRSHSLDDGVPDRVWPQLITLQVAKGEKMRDIIDLLAQSTKTNWVAEIENYDFIGLGLMKNGKILVLQPKQKIYSDRAQLTFYPAPQQKVD